MTEKAARKHDRGLLAIGAVFAGSGLYFVLCGVGLLPPPSEVNGPIWLVAAAGLAFFATGVSLLTRAWFAVPDKRADLPAGTPVIIVAIQWLAGLTIIAGLASIATWIAFGAGTREFSMSLPLTGSIAETIGRIVFGFGAIITWLMFAIMAYGCVGKIRGRKG